MKYNRLTTGEKYTLYNLFSNDNVVIIPDLQRDYCWGNISNDRDLVHDFVKNIIDNSNSELNLGLIYGYESPIGHIQLCDGQQRITTLFLLLGLINKKSRNAFQNQLISLFELEHDDKDPYLQYSIRESSLYFISDLVCHFFIAENTLTVSDIKLQSWYFKDYDLDPSIQSMLSALLTIEQQIININALELGDCVVNRLSFIYYDMGTKRNGEETFVIINTTGEPLTATENLKPLFIGAQKAEKAEYCSRKWEEWETWFWKMRRGAGNKENDTADNGFREFLRWITLLNTNDTEFKRIQETSLFDFDLNFDVDEINEYFNIVKYLFEDSDLFNNNLDWLAPNEVNNQIVWFRLLPIIEYIKKFGKSNIRNTIRVKTFFKNLSRVDNISKAVGILLPEAINIIKKMDSDDIAEIINLYGLSTQILTEEERRKFTIYIENHGSRVEMENALWKAEEHPIWKGEILTLVNWTTIDGNFNFTLFNEFNKVFCKLFYDTLKYPELDITRRALLTRNLKEYPRKFKGYTNTSFCWEYSDWQTLINENELEIGKFLHELIHASDIDLELQSMINNNLPEKEFDEFVKIPELLEYCTQKNIQYSHKDGWLLVSGQKTSGDYAILKFYRTYLDMKSVPFWDIEAWKVNFYGTYGRCIYFDNKEADIAIDLIFVDESNYKVEVFRRKSNSDSIKNDLLFLEQDLNWNGVRYESNLINIQDSIELIKRIQHTNFSNIVNDSSVKYSI
ncbi:uncharacterized protein with ParB-like and HNH nuclease domain [Flavobacterium sp. 270]|uniref:DUF262 domain-containing protein n=1 Tax=Flavobacterium sp. 270 TaxID=2512114 RepID=UPI0010658761|nr:DUF262 domain-containing protein [Flavobacterium sp. 270]TDW52743.1 uncharacterized protein with ParB-like and HNH nuclease domain [Flavobacterium sp. 270]